MKFIILSFFFSASLSAGAQTIGTKAECMPKPAYNLVVYIARNFHYPDSAIEFTGRIVVEFVVNEDGRLSNFRVVKGLQMKKEILQFMHAMPKWEPGRQNGKAVKMKYTLPINIEIE